MKTMLILAMLAVLAPLACALTITQAEYFVNTDPGAGNGTPIAVTTADTVTISALFVPTGSLGENLSHRVFLRYRSEEGPWSAPLMQRFFLFEPEPALEHQANVNDLQYWFDNQAPVTIDIPDEHHATWSALLPTTGLALNTSHKFTVRYVSNTGELSNPEARYFFIHRDADDGGYGIRRITHLEYFFDNDAPVLIDLADATFESWTALIPAAALTVNRSHKFTVRYLDDRGLWSNPEARYFFLHDDPGSDYEPRIVTHLQYWVDSTAATTLDIADGWNVNFLDSVAHYAAAGTHRFYLRYRDDTGVWGPTEARPFFVWTGVGPRGNARLTAAEWFVNVDPGIGNGMQVLLPQDSAWDELNEDAAFYITGVPTGVHLFGIRFRDELGNWSITLLDTFVVGPVLVIKPQGNNIVLSWIANPDHTPFNVYRSGEVAGTYSNIGSSDSLSYTDVGAVAASPKQFYYVTVNTTAFSTFRLPMASEAPPPKW
ncbi:hypothetical protein HZB60_02630 [candidate division KSB1 bacterium]|nr:hypothetical protein [candidate division KSB1 bacterium]